MPKKKVSLETVNRKLDKLLATQKKIFSVGRKVHREEHEELERLEELKKYEEEIKKELGPHPLRKITHRDIAKGTLGALIGVVAHYTFVYGIKVAHDIDLVRATLLYPLSYGLGGIFMYVTGFRKVKDKKLLAFLPLRLTILYIVAVVTAMLTLLLFNPGFTHDFWEAYKQVATVTLTATIGACTADLVGRE